MKIASNELITEIQTRPTLRNVTLLAELVIGQAAHFPHGTEAAMIGQDTQRWMIAHRLAARAKLSPARTPDTAELIELHDRLSALVTARQEHSDTLAPTVEPSVSVTLWGTSAGDLVDAAQIAAKRLIIEQDLTRELSLVDRTSVETVDAVGTRYVFRAVSA